MTNTTKSLHTQKKNMAVCSTSRNMEAVKKQSIQHTDGSQNEDIKGKEERRN